MNEPKVAICMCCYNHEKFIGEAMDSIINQTYLNWELYVANDGSTDRTGEILETYKDERIHYYNFKENTRFVGVSNFLQNVMKDSDADYIASMASDDLWREDKLEKQIKILQEHPEYRACFTWDQVIFSIEKFSVDLSYSHKENRSRFDWIRQYFFHGNCMNANSVLMEKDIFYELGRMNQYFIVLADFRLWFKFVDKYPFYLIDEELTYYRRHESNISNPSLEGVVRGRNEDYRIYSELILPMKKHTFRRAFYKSLSYANCDSQEDLLAEKFILLMNTHTASLEQVAMNLFFEHCDNEKFTSILDEKYGFGSHEFINLTGNAGMTYGVNEIFGKDIIHKNGMNTFSPVAVLLNYIDANKLNAVTISELLYSTMFDLYEVTRKIEGGNLQFNRLKEKIDNIRREKLVNITKKKILYLVSEGTSWDVAWIDKYNHGEVAEYMIAYIPSKRDIFATSEKVSISQKRELQNNIKYLDLYNEKEHCIDFLKEQLEYADIIYYVDCLDNRYTCGEMIAGYSLGVENRCILQENIYQEMTATDNEILQMMGEIHTYI